MIVAFYLDSQDDILMACARKCISSVRKHMPQAEVVQLGDGGDLGVPRIFGEKNRPFAYRRNDAHAMVNGEAIFLDVDVEVRADLSHVFKQDFDVAIAADMSPGSEGIKFDSGIAFSRNPQVWKDLRDFVAGYDFRKEDGDWRPVMEAYTAFFEQRKYKTLVLPSHVYCYVPSADGELTNAKAVHFRGGRKAWM